jgi:amidase
LKPTLGIVPGDGIIPISRRFDTAGPMAKSVKDIADILSVIVDSSKTNIPEGGYASALNGSDAWKEFTVGTLHPDHWFPDNEFVKPVSEATEQIVSAHFHNPSSAFSHDTNQAPSYAYNTPSVEKP